MSRSLGVLMLAGLLVLSAVAGPAAAAPSGFVNVASSNITDDLPGNYEGTLTAADLQGQTLASAHADTLEVVVTTPDRASDYVNGTTVAGDGVALVLRDDSEHAGREVALPAAEIREAFGYLPEQVHGTHDDGSSWARETRVDDGSLVFEVPGFSTNVVTFSSTTRLEATPATNGTTWRYNLSTLDGASDPVVDLTGVSNSENDTDSASAVADGGSLPIDVAGTSPATNATVTFTGISRGGGSWEPMADEGDNSHDGNLAFAGDNADDTPVQMAFEFTPGVSGEITSIGPQVAWTSGSDYNMDITLRLVEGGVDGNFGEGTVIATNKELSPNAGRRNIAVDTPATVEAGTTYHIEVITTNVAANAAGDTIYVYKDDSAGGTEIVVGGTGYSSYSMTRVYLDPINTTDPSIDVDGDGNADANVSGELSDGETVTKSLPDLPVGSNTGNVSTSLGETDVTVNYTEHTVTQNPAVTINNNTLQHTGTLADGETVTLTGESAWLQEGENVVSVQVDDPSADAPPGAVDTIVQHDSQDTQTYSSDSGKWVQEATVTKTFPSERSDATVQLALDSGVVDVATLEDCRNGTCTALGSSDYTLNTSSNTLTVQLGAVDAGQNVTVNFVAQKVAVVNGTIDVTQLTPPGSDLATEFTISSYSPGFHVDVSGTNDADNLHYVDAASWTGSPYAQVDSGGGQVVLMPDAGEGSTATMRTIPLSVVTNAGTADIRVLDAGALKFRVLGSTADALTYTYLAAEGGQAYRLWSVDDSQESSAGDGPNAEFVTGGQAETYRIEEKPSSGSVTQPTTVVQATEGGGVPITQLLVLFGGITGSLLLTVFAGRKLGFSTGKSNGLLAAVGVTVGVVGVELATAQSVLGTIVQAVFSGAFGGGAGSVVVGTLLLTGLFVVDARFLELPTWLLLVGGGLIVLYSVNGVTGGALSDGLRETGALIWLLVAGGGILVLWRAVKGPTINIGGGNQ